MMAPPRAIQPSQIFSTFYRPFASRMSPPKPTVAVLFQDIDPPVINGVCKPRKPGGYQDSGADIAYVLRRKGIDIVTPKPDPDPTREEGWCFPDTEEGICDAVQRGATHLWANTILFKDHPLQASKKLTQYENQLHVVGQPASIVEDFDDKLCVYEKLQGSGKKFTFPWFKKLERVTGWVESLRADIAVDRFPIVGKPLRGRGSHGVKVCGDYPSLLEHIEALFEESPIVLLEEYLSGEEATITVMPPTKEDLRCRSLPPVTRFNHIGGIAPYNGTVAVTRNSRVVTDDEMKRDSFYGAAMKECERAAEVLGVAAPIRVDVRRFKQGSDFALFDINMKPNMTGPGRPGREDQASLTAMAAAAIGWDYPMLLQSILQTSKPLPEWRSLGSSSS